MSDNYSANCGHGSGHHGTSRGQTGPVIVNSLSNLPQADPVPQSHLPPHSIVGGPGGSGVDYNHQACCTQTLIPPNQSSLAILDGNNRPNQRLAKGFTCPGCHIKLTDKKKILEHLFSMYPSTRTDVTWIAYVWFCPCVDVRCPYWSPQKSNLKIHTENIHEKTMSDADFEQQKNMFTFIDGIAYWRHKDENLLLIEKFKDIRPEDIPLRSPVKAEDTPSSSMPASTPIVNIASPSQVESRLQGVENAEVDDYCCNEHYNSVPGPDPTQLDDTSAVLSDTTQSDEDFQRYMMFLENGSPFLDEFLEGFARGINHICLAMQESNGQDSQLR